MHAFSAQKYHCKCITFVVCLIFVEEMISEEYVLYWNPKSNKVAFLQTNDSAVERIKYSW